MHVASGYTWTLSDKFYIVYMCSLSFLHALIVFLYALIYLSDAYHTPVNLCHSIKLLYFLLLERDITAEPATAVLGFTLRKLVRRYT